MNSEDGQVYSVCILLLQFSYTAVNYKQTKCEHSRRNPYRLQLSQQVSQYKIKKLFKKTISNSSLNSHVYWDTLYYSVHLSRGGGVISTITAKLSWLLECLFTTNMKNSEHILLLNRSSIRENMISFLQAIHFSLKLIKSILNLLVY